MPLIDHHATLHQVHVGSVIVSGTLFAARALALLARARWPLALPARAASWAVDSALLAAGVLLWAALRIDLLPPPWLATKLALLVAYVVLGTLALRHARTPAARIGWTLAALACFGFIVTVALARDPLGPLTFIMRG